jgi:hypothetical protein
MREEWDSPTRLRAALSTFKVGRPRAFITGMILLLSSVSKAKDCARALGEVSHEPVEVCTGVQEAINKLQAHNFTVAILDQLVLDSELDHEDVIYKHLGPAIPVYVNFAICGVERVVREIRRVSHRRKREVEAARRDARGELRQKLNDTLTAMLLSCQMALEIPDLPQLAASKMHDVEALANDLSTRLGAA